MANEITEQDRAELHGIMVQYRSEWLADIEEYRKRVFYNDQLFIRWRYTRFGSVCKFLGIPSRWFPPTWTGKWIYREVD